MRTLILSCALLLMTSAIVHSADVRMSVSDITDNRSTGHFSQLEVKLKVMGDAVSDAKGVRVRITGATDDTGRNLLREKDDRDDFTQIGDEGPGQSEIAVKLKNPARKATVIRELTGEVSLFMPKMDPGSSAVIDRFMTKGGKPLEHKALKAAQVGVTVLTRADFEELREKRKRDIKDGGGEAVKELGEALAGVFGALFEGMMQIGDNSVILGVDDPQSRVMAIEFLDRNGKRISSQSSMRMNDVRTYEFEKPMPQDAQMIIYLVTAKSLVKEEVKLKDIPLP